MRSLSVTFFLSLLFTAWTSQATLTVTVLNGGSRSILDSVDSAGVPVKATLYGGYVSGAAACPTDGSACNSCTGGGLTPCNQNGIDPNSKIHIELLSTTTYTAGAAVYIKGSGGSASWTPPSVSSALGTTVTVDIPWSELCGQMDSTNCGSSIPNNAVFSIGVDQAQSGTPTDTTTINIVFTIIKTTDNVTYTDCPLGSEFAYGFCHVIISRGDGKVYADPLVQGSSYPTTPPTTADPSGSGAKFSSVILFYEKAEPGDDGTAALAKITNNSPSAVIPMNTDATPATYADNRITGLENDTLYCFKMANQDSAGNIYLFSPPGLLPADVCATPSMVVGLLDDKHCFIATAAFGSEMAPEVNVFRHFRNQFLLKNKLGRRFVTTYYNLSPPLARFISQHDSLRWAARTALWPLLLFAKLSLQWGVWATLLALIFVSLLLQQLYSRKLSSVLRRRSR